MADGKFHVVASRIGPDGRTGDRWSTIAADLETHADASARLTLANIVDPPMCAMIVSEEGGLFVWHEMRIPNTWGNYLRTAMDRICRLSFGSPASVTRRIMNAVYLATERDQIPEPAKKGEPPVDANGILIIEEEKPKPKGKKK